MNDLLAWAAEQISAHQAWAGPIVGVLVLVESLAFVGFLVPSTALLLAIGGLMGAGVVEPVPVLLWAFGGAVVGDAVSFWMGRLLGPGALYRPPLRRFRPAVVRARLFFRRFGIFAVILGRFAGPVRCMVPFVAGMFRMRQARFQVANVVGAALWLPAMFAPGYLGAKGLNYLERFGDKAVIAGVAVAVLLLLVAKPLWRRLRGSQAAG